VLKANNLTLPSGQLSTDGTKTPVSTIGTLTSVEQVQTSSSARPGRRRTSRP
jgi:multidrug efflux pump subunit AcrB